MTTAAAGEAQEEIRVRQSLILPREVEEEMKAVAPDESNQIKPDQTVEEVQSSQGKAGGAGAGEGLPRNLPDAANRGDMGESNQIKPNQTF